LLELLILAEVEEEGIGIGGEAEALFFDFEPELSNGVGGFHYALEGFAGGGFDHWRSCGLVSWKNGNGVGRMRSCTDLHFLCGFVDFEDVWGVWLIDVSVLAGIELGVGIQKRN
jgi:hypothetical protein